MTLRIRELHTSYRTRTVEDDGVLTRQISSPRAAATLAAALPVPSGGRLADSPVEVFGTLLLNAKHRVIAWRLISVGTLDSAVVHPREVLSAALDARAAAIVVFHNHPSGQPDPSPEDVQLTARLASAGSLVGINLLEHVIIGHDGDYFSFRERGLL